MQKDDYTAKCKLYHKDINVEYMGFSAIKQQSEKKLYLELSSQLAKENVPVSSNVTCKHLTDQMDKSTGKERLNILRTFYKSFH